MSPHFLFDDGMLDADGGANIPPVMADVVVERGVSSDLADEWHGDAEKPEDTDGDQEVSDAFEHHSLV